MIFIFKKINYYDNPWQITKFFIFQLYFYFIFFLCVNEKHYTKSLIKKKYLEHECLQVLIIQNHSKFPLNVSHTIESEVSWKIMELQSSWIENHINKACLLFSIEFNVSLKLVHWFVGQLIDTWTRHVLYARFSIRLEMHGPLLSRMFRTACDT